MSLEVIFYSLGIAAIVVNFLVLFVLGVVVYVAWRKYQAFKRSAVAGMVTAAAAAIPRLALFPIAKKLFYFFSDRSRNTKEQ
ncbi:hypothetical protein LRY65_00330 [Candidatus Woesebacteria bacterium]|nr:hypothetical protein [Candidatus Woesebacteria bacterium]MCD8507762.1 hypothetical protein [Candidatus Woesebacteria bacterium]MCD8526652.1 hypothetical protein [Candidatus Woesebacteria bacterium]MCD8545880.1 hypothetical protein [Candidatus Woesebacteria bacterium]